MLRREKDLPRLRAGSSYFDVLFGEDPWYRELFSDFRELGPDELPAGIASGCEFGSVCINTMLYLPWLLGQCRANGVVLRRGQVAHVADAAGLSHHHAGQKADVVINTTGLLASRLGGVADAAVHPLRGQVVVVRNEAPHMLAVSGTDDAPDEMCYAMTRASGGGTVLGGSAQRGQWESQPDANLAVRIMRRAVEMLPELVPAGAGIGGLDIIRHGVGLRPARDGGVRLEKERVAAGNDAGGGGGGSAWVVHNYGHAGWGYQGSYGCAERVVELVDEILSQPKL